ncbi:chromosome segregation protein SMC [Clostridiaceae bacterium M8S5]|nr:chromosome segregation protein SMC [Clostridiaceae bacterium M8S5]
MYLKRIELNGFKSFADKTSIEFKEGITGVVGPNGSGKSNISDSIRWVLGEQSAKTLRGGKMQDVIFSGTSTRKPVGYAEITLVMDNKNKKLPLDYSEVNITRRVFRSGDSEYYINKTACRLKDIKELFMDTGVGIDGYSIIGQGRIDEILSTKSEDRRNLFEEAAGIVKYKTRKKEAEKKLEKTKDNLSRINDIIFELESQIEPLENQSRKAKKYLELSERLKKNEINLFVHEIDHIEEKKMVLKKQIESLQKQKSFYTIENETIEKKLNDYKAKIDEISKVIEIDSDIKYDMHSKIEKKEGDILLINERNIFLNAENERLEKESVLAKQNISDIEEKKGKTHLDLETLTKDISAVENRLESGRGGLDEAQIKITENQNLIEEKKSELIHNLNLEAEKKSKINMMESFNKNIDKRIDQLNTEIKEYESKIDEKNVHLAGNKDKVDIEQKRLTDISIDIDSNRNKRTNLVNLFNDKVKQMDNIKGELQGAISKARLLKDMEDEYDGFYKSVKNILVASKGYHSFSKGIKGVVAELIKVDQRYERAIEIALGASIQNVVTENDVSAKSAVEYLKKNKLGRVTFLPMNLIKGNRINQRYSNEGFIGIACDLIDYDSKYKNIFEHLLGKTIIVDNLDNGIKLLKSLNKYAKIVTLDGDVLSPGGSITGGSYNKKNTSLLSRKRIIDELEEKITENKKQYKIIEDECIKLKNDIKETEEDSNDKKDELDALKVKIINLKNEIIKDEESIQNIELSINKLNQQRESLTEENIGSRDDLDRLNEEILKLNDENVIIKKHIDEIEEANNRAKEEYEQKSKEIIQMQMKLASSIENKRHISESIVRLDESKDDSTKKLEEIGLLLEENNKKINENKINRDNFIKEKEEMEIALEKLAEKLEDYKEEKQEHIEVYDKAQEKFKLVMNKLNEYNEELQRVELKSEKYNIQLENYNNRLWEEYEMSYQMASGYKEEIENINIVKSEVSKLRKSIRALGNINLDSIEQFISVSERYEFMTSQRDDLTDAKTSLNQVIRDMETKMKDKFKENFVLIKKHFNEVFVKLFGGGKADIKLEDEEDILSSGIEIIAQPPGKKLQNIMLLSGGEKALTAIALLFAILKLKPTPFCILDEIEAALDDANVYRFADYLKHYSNNTQFIVITHRKGTMESVDTLYGVTMQEKGVSKVISVRLDDILDEVATS